MLTCEVQGTQLNPLMRRFGSELNLQALLCCLRLQQQVKTLDENTRTYCTIQRCLFNFLEIGLHAGCIDTVLTMVRDDANDRMTLKQIAYKQWTDREHIKIGAQYHNRGGRLQQKLAV